MTGLMNSKLANNMKTKTNEMNTGNTENTENARNLVPRVSVTPDAAKFIEQLKVKHGDLMFHQSGGCCDGSAPMCYQRGEFMVGQQDAYLGEIAGCPFYIGIKQFAYWQHTHLIIDVVAGRGHGFSLEAPEGRKFVTRSRVYNEKRKETTRKNAAATGRLAGSNIAPDTAPPDI